MRRALVIGLTVLVGLLAVPAVAPVSGSAGAVEQAYAQKVVTKAGSKGSASKVGDRAADLLRGWLGPILIALLGAITMVAFMKREIGLAITVLVIAVLAGLPIFAPGPTESMLKGIYNAVF